MDLLRLVLSEIGYERTAGQRQYSKAVVWHK